MQEVVSNVYNVVFDIEIALEQQLGAVPLPFPGMDKSGSAICVYFARNLCMRGSACPYRHVRNDRTVVCKHWLRGLCKKGDDCEFLHEYDMSKMPECFFYQRFGACSNKECPFLHIDPETKIKNCAWYDRGFCRHGPSCKNRHVRKIFCQNYLTGFCLEGGSCKLMHPRFEIPVTEYKPEQKAKLVVCHHCNEVGHKIIHCPKLPPEARAEYQNQANQRYQHQQQHQQMIAAAVAQHKQELENPTTATNIPGERRSLDEVTCFKCGDKGHYANKCPKGHLAFLSAPRPDHDPSAP